MFLCDTLEHWLLCITATKKNLAQPGSRAGLSQLVSPSQAEANAVGKMETIEAKREKNKRSCSYPLVAFTVSSACNTRVITSSISAMDSSGLLLLTIHTTHNSQLIILITPADRHSTYLNNSITIRLMLLVTLPLTT